MPEDADHGVCSRDSPADHLRIMDVSLDHQEALD
jgi:hypothetical protein